MIEKVKTSTSNKEIKKVKYIKVEKFIIKIYLKHHLFCKYKSIPLDEDMVDQFYEELNQDNKVMEFNDFYFNKENLDYVRAKSVKVKENVQE